jgi:REP element-mobilizing transposase RayT
MRNHFHLVLRIKTDDEVGWLINEHMYSREMALKWTTTFDLPKDKQGSSIKPVPIKMIGHLMSAYSKWFNKKYQRTGKRFEERIERREIKSNNYLRSAIKYVNRNPIKHGIVSEFEDYPWISYHALVNTNATWIARDRVIQCFGDYETFLLAMQQIDFDDWLNEK